MLDERKIRYDIYRAFEQMLEIADYCDKEARKPNLTDFQKGMKNGVLVINGVLRRGVIAMTQILENYSNAQESMLSCTQHWSEHEDLLEKLFDVRSDDDVIEFLKDEDYAAIREIYKRRVDKEMGRLDE